MIMDGLDTLSQVALANQLNISFDTYNPPLAQLSASMAGAARTPSEMADDNLNTPVTTCSDVNFSFLNSDIDVSQEALPITGEYSLRYDLRRTQSPTSTVRATAYDCYCLCSLFL